MCSIGPPYTFPNFQFFFLCTKIKTVCTTKSTCLYQNYFFLPKQIISNQNEIFDLKISFFLVTWLFKIFERSDWTTNSSKAMLIGAWGLFKLYQYSPPSEMHAIKQHPSKYCVTQLKLYTLDKLSRTIFCCLCVRHW